MLEELLKRLEATSPFYTRMAVHGPNTFVIKDCAILAADVVGVMAQTKGAFGSWGNPVLYPWSGVSFINLPD